MKPRDWWLIYGVTLAGGVLVNAATWFAARILWP